jgi:hypothetical protein
MKSTLVREVVDAVQVRVDRLNQLKHQERLRRQVLFDLRALTCQITRCVFARNEVSGNVPEGSNRH